MTTITTRRVSGSASGGKTSRVSAALTESSTKRIAGSAAGGATRRVNIGGHSADYDAWADSWAASWGEAWHVFYPASQLDNTCQRVSFVHHLIFEGDESGTLLLQGDEQDGAGSVLLEGDEALALAEHTRRVAIQ